jgi:hypothetical protein
MVFSRSSNGTRVNSAGLVEDCPWNLAYDSENFGSGYWTRLSSATITTNNTTAPNGTNTGALFSVTSTAYSGLLESIPDNTQTISMYAKKGTLDYLWFIHENISQLGASFNLNTGVVSFVASGHNASIESVGNGWYRCILSTTNSATWDFFQFGLSNASNSATSPSGGNAYIWGAQANIGSTAKPYFPTTDRLNVPRLTYQNGGGGCPSLLLEKQSTNLLTWSEDFTNATYTKIGVTATGNTTTSPDGTTNADSILEIATGGTHESWQRASMTSGQLYTQSCFLKANGRNRVVMQIFDNATQYASAIYDLSTGVVVASVGTATIQSMGNGWYRCTITGTSPATGSGYCVLGLCESTYTNSAVMPSYSGDASKGVYWWGAQLEQSSYATSYIGPTTSASATRVADACSKTGISSLIGQSQGTIFVDFVWEGLGTANIDNPIFSIGEQSYGTSNIAISNYNSSLYGRVTNGTSVDAGVAFGAMTIGTRYKCAIGYASNDFVFYVNGLNYGNDTSVSIPALSDAYFQNDYPNSKEVNQAVLFKTRLTNAELASLTTL